MWNHGVSRHWAKQTESASTASFPTSAYNLSQDLMRTVVYSLPPPTRHRQSVHALTLTRGPPRRPMRLDSKSSLNLGSRGGTRVRRHHVPFSPVHHVNSRAVGCCAWKHGVFASVRFGWHIEGGPESERHTYWGCIST